MRSNRHLRRSCFLHGQVILSAIVLLVSLAQAQYQFQVLHNFAGGSDGTSPSGSLLLGGHGALYGATAGGGAYGNGTAFLLTPGNDGWTEGILHSFNFYTDGDTPLAPLALDASGNVYGVTGAGGPQDLGTVYELSPSGDEWTLSLIYGSGSRVGLTSDGSGSLYGFLGSGAYQAGAIANLFSAGNDWVYSQLYSFCGQPHCQEGERAAAPLSWDAKGNLYGTTFWGGYPPPQCPQGLGCGVAFELVHNQPSDSVSSAASWTYHVMHRFGSFPDDGQSPNGGVVVDGKGNVYGTTTAGGGGCGSPGCGTVFMLSRTAAAPWFWKETILYNFPATPVCSQGCVPAYNLLMDKAGNLYGIAGGGSLACVDSCGLIFKLSPHPNGKWSYSIVHEFQKQDGAYPNGLAMDANGNLFGTTEAGGTYNLGVVYEITP